MEDGTVPLINYVPSFAQGLSILLVHNDTVSLKNLSSMLLQYSFRVTVTYEAQTALSLIYKQEGQFNLVMAKANVPDMEILSFLYFMSEKDIPVIFISDEAYDGVTWKALAKGSCYFLKEPILLEDLKYVWQHVYHKKLNAIEKNQRIKGKDKVYGTCDVNKCIQNEKSKSSQMHFVGNLGALEEEGGGRRKYNIFQYVEKKSRIVWTPELHQKFKDALSVLGDQNVRPKAIKQQMNVPGLTARHIASHLQKYKSQTQIDQEAYNSGSPPPSKSSNLSGGSEYSLPFESQSVPDELKCFPVSTASLSESQNQNQFPVNFTETQQSNILKLQQTPGNPNFTSVLPTETANCGSQNQEASMDQNLPILAYAKQRMLEEDCDMDIDYDYSRHGVLPEDVNQYSEILREVLLGNSPGPQEPDI